MFVRHPWSALAVHPGAWFGLALGLVLLFRLPFVPYAVMDWDESTFALVGDSVVRGHLPYTEIVENKPPLVFLHFALMQALFGKSILAIRLSSVVLTALTAWLCALAARRGLGLGGWSVLAMLPVAYLGTFAPGSGSMMAEHLALLPMTLALYLLTRERLRPWHGFALSLCAALAVLTRTNLAYPALLLALAAWVLPLEAGVSRVRFLAAFAAGALLPVLILLVAYRHHLDLLYGAMVKGPLAYAEGGRLFTPAWWREARSAGELALEPPTLPATLGLLAGAVGLLAGRGFTTTTRRTAWVLVGGGLATLAGICAGGRVFGHYLMQLLPFVAPLFAAAGFLVARRSRWVAGLLLVVLAVGWGEPLARKYLHHVRRVQAGEPLWNDPALQLVRYLDQAGARGRPLFLLEAHIGYWMLDSIPPSRVGHPSNFARTGLTQAVEGANWSAAAEFDAIFDRAPVFVVVPEDMTRLGLTQGLRAGLFRRLAAAYREVATIEGLRVFRLREDSL